MAGDRSTLLEKESELFADYMFLRNSRGVGLKQYPKTAR